MMGKHSTRYRTLKEKIEPGKLYPLSEAVALAKETSGVKFDAGVEIHIKLGVDVQKSDQTVRGTAVFPHELGKNVRIMAFVTPGNVQAAKEAGADLIGDDETIKKIQQTQKLDFDVAVAEPAVMKSLGPIAKTLGQRGLMPNPRTETVGKNVGEIIGQLKKGKAAFRSDDSGNVHQFIGRCSVDSGKLVENAQTFIEAVKRARPEAQKGTFMQSVTISTTMGPGIPVEL
jgi:large subunit ribosomal protein L1